MASKKKILSEMEQVVSSLAANAKDLHKCSKGAIAEEELERLQAQQDDLVKQLLQCDKTLAELGGTPSTGVVWKRIQTSLDEFQRLNQQFISNLTIRKGLIRFDLNTVKKSRRFLREMGVSYGKPGEAKKKPPQIDRLN